MARFRTIVPGETVELGDEWYDAENDQWVPARDIGPGALREYRRAIPTPTPIPQPVPDITALSTTELHAEVERRRGMKTVAINARKVREVLGERFGKFHVMVNVGSTTESVHESLLPVDSLRAQVLAACDQAIVDAEALP